MIALGPLAIGALIGLVLGLLGGGGAILAVPGLVYVLGVEPHAAIAASLAIVAVGAVTGLAAHARRGRVAWATAVQLGLTGALGAWIGAWAGRMIPGDRLLALLGLFMLLAAWLMVRRPRSDVERRPGPRWQVPLLGLGLGVLTGFFGVGGGIVDWPLTLLASLGAVGGALVGGRLAASAPERLLRRGFAGLVAVIAVFLVYRNAASLGVAFVTPLQAG